jgi:tRNA(Arg) A34 adenosine deaminase TadA
MKSEILLPSIFRHAIKAAAKSPHPRYPVGAALLKGRRLFCIGYNQFKTHTAIHGPQTLHAELHALTKRATHHQQDFSDFTLSVARITNTGFGMARPCVFCMRAIKLAGIHHIIYTTNTGWGEEWIQ